MEHLGSCIRKLLHVPVDNGRTFRRMRRNQKTEAKIGVRILNRMTELGRPNFERNA